MSYPKWKYHAEKSAVVVDSAEAEKALGDGWAESPADFEKSSESQVEVKPAKKSRSKG